MTHSQFNTFLINLRPDLYRFAYSLTKNTEDSNDLVQDTYIKAFSYRPKITDYSNLRSWTLTILKNKFINNYRAARTKNSVIDVTPDLYFINLTIDKGFHSPESSYAEKEIMKAINNLNYKLQVPFKLHVHGYKYEEIAKQLNLDLGTVKSRIFMARKQLMSVLRDYAA